MDLLAVWSSSNFLITSRFECQYVDKYFMSGMGMKQINVTV